MTGILAAQIESPQAKLAVFFACIAGAGAAGYALRRTGLAKAAWAKPIMSAAIIGVDAPIAWLAVWHLDIRGKALEATSGAAALDPSVIWKVPVAGGIVAMATSLIGLAIARRLRMDPKDRAVFGLQAGMGNVGYTLGGALCFVLWGIQGLGLEQMFCMMWPFFAFLFCFPIARHYGEPPASKGPRPSVLRYVADVLTRSLTDLRSLPLYTVALGLALNLKGFKPSPVIQQWHLIDALMVAGIVMQFGSVGLTVRLRRLAPFWKPALGTSALKFLVSPALMLGAALAFGLSGVPLYVCLLLAAMPTALYSVLMANLFDLNRDLANTTFILTHLVCFVVIVPVLFLLTR